MILGPFDHGEATQLHRDQRKNELNAIADPSSMGFVHNNDSLYRFNNTSEENTIEAARLEAGFQNEVLKQ